jgi:hypothetical protein
LQDIERITLNKIIIIDISRKFRFCERSPTRLGGIIMFDIYFILSIPLGWMTISKLQRGFIIFTTIERYFFSKLVFSIFLGWIVAPFYILWYLYKFFENKQGGMQTQTQSQPQALLQSNSQPKSNPPLPLPSVAKETTICPNCNYQLEYSSGFCRYCGGGPMGQPPKTM